MGHFLQKESWSFALLATSKRRGGLYFVNFQMTGVCCAFVIPKKTKTVPESMRGRTRGSLLPLLFFFLSPSTPFSHPLSPFSSFFPFGFVSCLPHFPPPFSHLSPFFHPLLSPTPVSLHSFPLIYVVMIVVNTIHTFVLLRGGNLIFWWPSVIHVSYCMIKQEC